MSRYTPKPSKDYKGWFESPTYPYFVVNEEGKLKNKKTGYETNGSKDDRGYMRACIWDNDTKSKREVKVHRVVCSAFHGPCPKDKEVGHKDDIRDNNHPNNLHYTTRKKNMAKANSQEGLWAKW